MGRYAIEALLPFWADLKVSHVKGETCRRYAKVRKRVTMRGSKGEPIEWELISVGTVRRELGTLQAAINYSHKEGLLTSAPVVTLPSKPQPKDRWLTRDEAAKLLWTAYRSHKSKHIARFILIGLYTGTRKDAIIRMGFCKNTIGGWFDLEAGIMFRMSESERITKKRRTPAPIPRQLLGHLKRWHAQGCHWAVEYNGGMIKDPKRGFAKAAKEAGLTDVSPHTLKHTAITWALQNGVKTWEASGYFATSQETIEKVYGHHAPDFMESAKKTIERRRK